MTPRRADRGGTGRGYITPCTAHTNGDAAARDADEGVIHASPRGRYDIIQLSMHFKYIR